MEIGWHAAVALRLARQGLTAPAFSAPGAVSAMAGAHAQVTSAAELSIAARTSDVIASEVRTALLPGGPLVKTYGPRGTLHLFPRDELPLWCAALDQLPSGTTLPQPDRLSPGQQLEVVAALRSILSSDAARESPPDAEALDTAIGALTGPWALDLTTPAFGGRWPRWRQAIGAAARQGVLSFGENRGTRVTYVSPDITPEPDNERAVRWLVTKFLGSYGPATSAQFARWLGTKPALAAAAFERLSDDLLAVRFEGQVAYIAAQDESAFGAPAFSPASARLLPHFDPYLIGSFPRELLFPGVAATRALTRGQAGTRPVILLDGVVHGIWTVRRTERRFDVTVEPFAPMSVRAISELVADAGRMARFLGLEPSFQLGEVTARAHL